MQDRYLYRGKRVHGGELIYGQVLYFGESVYIVSELLGVTEEYVELEWWHQVEPTTVKRCTGLRSDKSYRGESEQDRIVFVGDIVREDTNIAIVRFGYYTANNNKSYNNEEAYGFYLEYSSHPAVIDHISDFGCWEIIGNIHDRTEEATC